MATTAENELRMMIGDLTMQVAMLRAELINAKEAKPEPTGKPNGKAKEEHHGEGHHPPQ